MPLRKVVVVDRVDNLVVEGETIIENAAAQAAVSVGMGMGVGAQNAAGVSLTVSLETAEKLGRSLLKVGRELRKEHLT